MSNDIEKKEEDVLRDRRRLQIERLMVLGHTKPSLILNIISDPLHPEPKRRDKGEGNPYYSLNIKRETWSLATIRNDMDYIRSEWSTDMRQQEENKAYLYATARYMIDVARNYATEKQSAQWSREMREWMEVYAKVTGIYEEESNIDVLQVKQNQDALRDEILRRISSSSNREIILNVDSDSE